MALVTVAADGTIPDITQTGVARQDLVIINNTTAAITVPLPGNVVVAGITDGGGIEPTHNERDGILTVQPHSHVVVMHTANTAADLVFEGMRTTHRTSAAASAERGTAVIIQQITGGASD